MKQTFPLYRAAGWLKLTAFGVVDAVEQRKDGLYILHMQGQSFEVADNKEGELCERFPPQLPGVGND